MSRQYDLMREGDRASALAAAIEAQIHLREFHPDSSGNAALPRATDVSLFVRVLQRQWKLVAYCAGAILFVVALATLLMKPTYQPWARLEVDPPGYEAFSLATPQALGDDTAYLQTQVESVQSDQLAVGVIRSLALAPNLIPGAAPAALAPSAQDAVVLTGESAALAEFKHRLKVQHDPGSHVISISVPSHGASQAADITNTLANLYVRRMSDARHEAIVQSVDWLSQQLQDIRKRMDDSNNTLAEFEKANGVADVDAGRSTFGEMLADLNRQLSQATTDRIQLQTLVNNKTNGGDPDALPEVHNSLLIQQLTQKLAEAQADLAQSRVIYGPNHPNVKRLENQTNELKAQLQQQKKGIYEELKAQYEAAQARERIMSNRVNDTTRQLSLIAQYNALKRESQANADLYNTLFSKIKEAEISTASKSNNVRVMDPARVLVRPTSPNFLLNCLLGLVSGVVLGVVAAFVNESLTGFVRTAEDVRLCDARLPVSIVPVIEGDKKRGLLEFLTSSSRNGTSRKAYELLLMSRPQSAEAEAVRGLRASLVLSGANQPPQALLIASSLPGEGKTTVAINLAAALAQQGRACVVDCDLRRSSISSIFGRASEPGLAEVLTGKMGLAEVIFDTQVADLSVVPCGWSPHEAYDLILRQDFMRDTLKELRDKFTFIILDSPPILPYAEGRVLSTIVDGVVFVGRPRVTTRDAMRRSLELLSEVRSAPILEVVLNAAESDCADYQYYRCAYK